MAGTFDAFAGWAPSVFVAANNIASLVGGVFGAFLLCWRGGHVNPFETRSERQQRRAFAPAWARHITKLSPQAFAIAIGWGAYCATVPVVIALLANELVFPPELTGHSNLVLWSVWELGTWVFITALTLFGGVIGSFLPAWSAALISGLVAYGVGWGPMLIGGLHSGSLLYGYVDFLWFFYEPTVFAALMRAGLWVGVSTILTSIGIRSLTWVVIGGMCAFSSVISGYGATNQLSPVHSAFQMRCTGENPRVCTPMPSASSLAALNAYLRPGIDLLPDAVVPEIVGTHRFVAPSMTGKQLLIDPTDREAVPSHMPTQIDVVTGLGRAHLARHCPTFENVPVATLAPYLVFIHKATDGEYSLEELATHTRVLPPGARVDQALPKARELAELSDIECSAYLAEHYGEIQSCGITTT